MWPPANSIKHLSGVSMAGARAWRFLVAELALIQQAEVCCGPLSALTRPQVLLVTRIHGQHLGSDVLNTPLLDTAKPVTADADEGGGLWFLARTEG